MIKKIILLVIIFSFFTLFGCIEDDTKDLQIQDMNNEINTLNNELKSLKSELKKKTRDAEACYTQRDAYKELYLQKEKQIKLLTEYYDKGFIENEFTYCLFHVDSSDIRSDYTSLHNSYAQKMKVKLYRTINDYFENLYLNENYDENSIQEKVYNRIQDLFLESAIPNELADFERINDYEYKYKFDKAFMVISLVQNIPYDYYSVAYKNAKNKYPYNVLYYNRGICLEKAYLMTNLLSKLGYGTAIFLFETHAAVGIKCPSEYDYRDTGYCLIEPTVLSYVGEYTDSNDPLYNNFEKVIKISDGKTYEYAHIHYANYKKKVNVLSTCKSINR